MITHDIAVPAARRNAIEMSGVTLTSVPSVLMITKGKPWLEQALPTPPTAARAFVAGDQMTAAVEVYRQGTPAAGATLVARLNRRDGSPSGFEERRVVQAAGSGSEAIGFPIDTARLPVGLYVLRVSLEGQERSLSSGSCRSKSSEDERPAFSEIWELNSRQPQPSG